jgi:serine/threonine protein kinase/DNA-directed RNA polymerase subunit RPC12/RpoP
MIAFSCIHCGMKFQVKSEFAGRSTRCPTCKQPLVVPQEATVPLAVPSRLDGTPSSLARADFVCDVTLGGPRPSGKEAASPPVAEILAGRNSNGQRYLLEGEIARGGMGAVLRAVDCDIRREVAVKYLLDQSNPRKKARFVEEAQITGQLEHPSIVPIHELGVDAENRLFFAMKMVRGRSLEQVLDEWRDSPRSAEKEYPLSRLLTVFVNVCHALAYAHSRGVVHRDLKPANIMLGDFGEVYVMDWGLAKVLGREPAAEQPAPVIEAAPTPSFAWAEGDSSAATPSIRTSRQEEDDRTLDGTVLGTPVYMPPEQAAGRVSAVDRRSDVYSLGAILYEMLTLQPPVDRSGGHLAVLLRVSRGEIASPAERAPERARAGRIPPELAAVAMKALSHEPAARYPSVVDLRRDVELFLEGRSVSAKEDSKWEALWKFVKRNKGFSAAVAVAALLLTVVLAGSAWVNYRARLRAEQAYADYLRSQEEKREQARSSAPAFVEAARACVNRKQFDDALAQVSVALEYDPDEADGHLLKGQLLIARQQFTAAHKELQEYLRLRPADERVRALAQRCATARVNDPATALALADLLLSQLVPTLAQELTRASGQGHEVARRRIEAAWPGLGKRLTMDADGNLSLDLERCAAVADLAHLQGMPLKKLILDGTKVADLTPLKGMPLTTLRFVQCDGVRDLTPLKGMPLEDLAISGSQVRDLKPLKGMPLTALAVIDCGRLTDLTPLQGMGLTNLTLSGCDPVKDLTPLKGMPLTHLTIQHGNQITDLAPLAGMPLTFLHLAECNRIKDLTPLKKMSLTRLNLYSCAVTDLTPLAGMPLTYLHLDGTAVRDLTPLEGMPLHELFLGQVPTAESLNVLRRLKSLERINDRPAADYFKQHKAGKTDP